MDDPPLVVGVSPDRRGTLVEAADATDGHLIWSARLAAPRPGEPFFGPVEGLAAGHGVVVVSGWEGVRTLDAATGRLLWDVPNASLSNDEDLTSVVVDADAVYASTTDGATTLVHRYDRLTGAEVWRREAVGRIAGGEDDLVVGDPCGWETLDKATGAVGGSAAAPAGCLRGGAAPVADGRLFADDRGDGDIVLRRLATGTAATTLPGSGGEDAVVAAKDGVWLVGGPGGVTAYDDDGAVVWHVERPAAGYTAHYAVHDDLVVEDVVHDGGSPTTQYGTVVRLRDLHTGAVHTTVRPSVGRGGALPGAGPLVLSGTPATVLTPGAPGLQLGRTAPPEGTSDPAIVFGGLTTVTSAQNVLVPFEAPAGSATTCRVDGGSWTSCTSPWRTPDLAEGDRAIDVRSGDDPPVRDWVTVDRTAPVARFTTLPDPVVSGLHGSSQVQYTADEPLATFECRLDGSSWEACDRSFGGSIDLSAGVHRIDVRATDRAGNVGPATSASWREDRVSPSVTVPRQDDPIDGYTADVAFAASDGQGGVTSRCALRTARTGDDPPGDLVTDGPCTSPWHVSVPGPGRYRVTVTTTDDAGNTADASGLRTFLAQSDIVAGFTTRVSRSDGVGTESPYWGREITATQTRSEVGGLLITNSCRAVPVGAPADGAWTTCGSVSPSADGRYLLQVRATDAAGRAGPIQEVPFGLDRTPPVVRLAGGQVDPVPPGTTIDLPRKEVDAAGPDESPIVAQSCTVEVDSQPLPGRTCGETAQMGTSSGVRIWADATDEAGNSAEAFRQVSPRAPDPGPGTTQDPPITTPTTTTAPPATATDGAPSTTSPGAPPPVTPPDAAGLAALLAGLHPAPPGAGTKPGVPPSSPAPGAACASRGTRGSGAPSIRSVARTGVRLSATIRVPGASRSHPARVVLQGRAGCGSWRTLARGTTRSTTLRLRVSRGTSSVDGVRVRSTRRGVTTTSVARAVR